MFNLENYQYTYNRIKYFMSYHWILAFISILQILSFIIFNTDTIQMKILRILKELSENYIFLAYAIVIISILLSIVVSIWVLKQRSIKEYYIDQAACSFVYKYHGRWMWGLLGFIILIVENLLVSSNLSFLSISITNLHYILDIYYYYSHNNRCKSIYKSGGVYKFVRDLGMVSVYTCIDDQDYLLHAFGI